jgi:hypothetical protein
VITLNGFHGKTNSLELVIFVHYNWGLSYPGKNGNIKKNTIKVYVFIAR